MISAPRARPAILVDRRPIVISLIVHLAAAAAIGLMLQMTPPLRPLERASAPVESVDYIDLDWPVGSPGDGGGVESSEVAGASDDAQGAQTRQPDAAPLLFPGLVPSDIAAPTGSSGVGAPNAGGAAAGQAGGAGDRLRPGFRDSRLYVDPAIEALKQTDTRSNHQKYMEHLTARINASNDSVAGASRGPNRDWTFRDGNGGRWGLSEDGLHLGGLTVPKELVPRPQSSGDNQKQEQVREEQRQRDEIRRQEDDRARREAQEAAIRSARERAEAQR